MAIPDIGKMFETTNAQQHKYLPTSIQANKNALVVLFMTGKRSSSALDIANVFDEAGNVYEWEARRSTNGFVAIAYSRLSNTLPVGDHVTIDFNATPNSMWISGHVFEGAGGVPTDVVSGATSGTNVQAILDVVGTDWLAVAVFSLYSLSSATITPVGSSVSQDSASGPPYSEAFSRNGTTGSTFTIGGTISTSASYSAVAISFPSDAMPSPSKNQLLGMAV